MRPKTVFVNKKEKSIKKRKTVGHYWQNYKKNYNDKNE